ncbi:hypothetical protein A1QO_00650 [Vibrio genomosp. F10 str. ZF-129]|uniref:PD-(D/E)XK endonuclease-like domain-containing protein n=1 Tax=Vibrio genomosp. F10 str. ZF-129 TaxID=1187848 RepID=A0A1E5BGA3_9VIBR|nr:hypothetical protein [Vibrio genomosp. F10]OEE35301.1 hypothetical protein A1QO_00650 [Vibrio genomosp. F10 str. ZF-129]
MYQFILILILLAIAIVLFTKFLDFIAALRYSDTPFGFRGKKLFLDDSKSKRGFAFIDKKYDIGATPDAVYETGFREGTVVEIKARYKGIYDSDIAQAEIAVLAMASDPNIPPIKYIVISNKTEQKTLNALSPKKTARKYRKSISLAKRILNGKFVKERNPDKKKCQNCRYFDECKPYIKDSL